MFMRHIYNVTTKKEAFMMTSVHDTSGFSAQRGKRLFPDSSMVHVGSFALMYITGLFLIWGRKIQSKFHIHINQT